MNNSNGSKFVTRKWNIAIDQSNTNCDIQNGVIYNTEVLKSNACDYKDVYILGGGYIVTTAYNTPTQLTFKNWEHSLNVSQKSMDQ